MEAAQLAEHWRMRAGQAMEVIVATEQYEDAQRRLLQGRVVQGKEVQPTTASGPASGTVDARLYAAMVKRNMKIEQVVKQWDADRDGFISRSEFVKEVSQLLPNTVSTEIEDLFHSLEDSSGGGVDVDELRRKMKALQTAAERAAVDDRQLTSEVEATNP